MNPSNLTLSIVGPSITVNPSQAQRSQSLAVVINGNFTHFQQGTTQANFGPGISVGGGPEGGAGLVTVTSPTTATANIVISGSAPQTTRSVVLQTGPEVVTLSNGFTVTGQASISLNPVQGQQGATLSVAITGANTNFVQGTTAVSFEPGVTVNSVSVNSPTSLTAGITIPNNTPLVSRDVTVATGAQVVTALNAFLVVAGPKSISAAPANGARAATMNVTITGVNTNFTGASQVTFTGGIVVNGVDQHRAIGDGQHNDPAGRGARRAYADRHHRTRGAQHSVFGDPGAGGTFSVNPGQGQQGQTLGVTITGTNTNFVQGTTSVNFGPGITVNSVAVSSATSRLLISRFRTTQL